MITYLVINLLFPGPFFIYAIGFGWIFYVFLLPVDIVLGIILTIILNGVREPWNSAKVRMMMGIFSVSLNPAFIGTFLALAVIIGFIRNRKEISLDYQTKHYNYIGLGFSILSVIMTIIFFAMIIVPMVKWG